MPTEPNLLTIPDNFTHTHGGPHRHAESESVIDLIAGPDPFTDPDADNLACPNCHPEPDADCYIDTLPLSDRLANRKPDSYPIADTAPDSAAERY